jgi:hypothetical protein
MFTITMLFKPQCAKLIAAEWTSLAGIDYDLSVTGIDCDFEDGERKPLDARLQKAIAGCRADALHEFLKETPYF